MRKSIQMALVLLLCLVMLLPTEVLAKSGTPYTNLSATTSGDNNSSISSGNIVFKVKGSLFGGSTGTLTLKNTGTENAILSFSYAVGGSYSSFDIVGNTTSGTGSYNAELAASASVTIKMVCDGGFSAQSGSITLSNIKLEVPKPANLTVSYNSLGTVTVGGSAVGSGDTVEVPAEGTTLVATPNSGAVFVGWINTADNSVFVAESFPSANPVSISYKPTGDASLKAVFTTPSSEALFWGSSKKYLFEGLSAAISHASSSSDKKIILAANGTLSAGEYTIPSGVTLVMPYDGSATTYTDKPGVVWDAWSSPTAYLTMTMADGAKLNVNGALSIPAVVSGKMGNSGNPTSKYGHIAMQKGSAITINNGANLYAWGYITGSGNVTVKSGGNVYESFQVIDWRGGTYSTAMLDNSQKVFPMTQYYVQNVEVPMKLEAGATENCSMAAKVSIYEAQVTVGFIGSSGKLFNISSGSVTKRYDGGEDRLILDINGEFSVGEFEITLMDIIIYSSRITTKNYVLPVTNNITLNVNNSSTLTFNQTISLLPGVRINIAEGGTLKVGSGKQLFVYDSEEWNGNGFIYHSGVGLADLAKLPYTPTRTYTRTSKDLVDAQINVQGTLDASAGYLYTTNGGSNIHSTGKGIVKTQAAQSSHTLYETTQTSDTPAYAEIGNTAAKLKNADGSYVDTGAGTYRYFNGSWHACSGAAATCTTAQICDTCGAEMAAKLGHDMKTVTGQAATCTAAGWTDYKDCSRCEHIEGKNPINALGHNLENVTGQAATCTAAGWSDYMDCSRCEYIEGKNPINALGHNLENVTGQAATCTAAGWTDYKDCSRCEYIEGKNPINALGHEMTKVVTARNEPTCTATGTTAVMGCSRCDHTEGGEAIPATGHTPGAAATCTTAQTCTVCDATVTAALGHTEAIDAAVAATCTTAGKTEGKHCSTCNTVLVAQNVVAALGHKPADDDGDCETAITCGVCGTETTAAMTHVAGEDDDDCSTAVMCTNEGCKQAAVAAKTHAYSESYQTQDNQHWKECTNEGCKVTTQKVDCADGEDDNHACDVCGNANVSDHKAGTAVQENVTAATCGAAGSYDNVVYCTECDGELSRETVTVPATGHSYSTAVTDPTCIEAGYTTYTCTCGDTYVSDEVAALGHSYNAAVTAPTCTEAGYTTYTCACGHTYTADETAALGHTWVDATVEAPKTCSVCKATEGSKLTAVAQIGDKKYASLAEAVAAAQSGDTIVLLADVQLDAVLVAVDKTIDLNGKTLKGDVAATLRMNGGNLVTTKYNMIGAADSIYSTTDAVVTIAANDTMDTTIHSGTIELTQQWWTLEGQKLVVEEAATFIVNQDASLGIRSTVVLKGNAVVDGTVDLMTDNATIQTAKKYENIVTSVADAVVWYNEGKYVVHTHSYESVVTAPTCTEAGYTTYTCACGDSNTGDTVAALGHTEVVDAAVGATCTETGLTEGKHCSVCGTVTVAQTDVAAKGHTEVIDKAVAATCTTAGKTEGKHCSVCNAVIVAQEEVPATGHSYNAVVTPPTFDADGYTTYTCACGDRYVVTDENSKLTAVAQIGEQKYETLADAVAAAQKDSTANTVKLLADVTNGYDDAPVVLLNGDILDLNGRTLTGAVVGTVSMNNGTLVTYADNGSTITMAGPAVENKETPKYVTTDAMFVLGADWSMTVTEGTASLGQSWQTLPGQSVTIASDAKVTIPKGKTFTIRGNVTVEEGAELTCEGTIELGYENASLTMAKTEDLVITSAVENTTVWHDGEKYMVHSHTPGAAATCTTAQTCTVCGAELNPKLGHTEVVDAAKAPTCTATGLTEGKHCSVCNEVLVAQETVDALGHSEVIDKAVAATCTETGLTEGSHCSVCNEVLVAQEVVAAKGHTEVIDAAVAATCTATGLTEGKHCSVCNVVLVAQEVVAAKGHTEVIDTAVAATCTTTGLTEGKHCSVCNTVTVKQTVTEKTPHTEEILAAVESTCTETGLTEGVKCSVCGDVLTEQEVVAAKGHTNGDVVIENSVAANCVNDGHYDKVVSCTVCGKEQSRETVVIPANGHTAGDKVTENHVDASCESGGSYDRVTYCTICNTEISRVTTNTPANGHIEVKHKAKAPTCTGNGWDAYVTCEKCDYTTYVEKPATGHTEVEIPAVEATCTTAGSTAGVKCSVCDKVLTTPTTVGALSHDLDAGTVTTPPSCTEAGVLTKSCSRCDYTETEEISNTGHTEVEIPAVDATCITAGSTTGVKCSVCDEVLTAPTVVEALQHDLDEGSVTTPPSCTEAGVLTKSCSRCNYTETEEISNTGHTEVEIPAVDATCTTAGSTAGVKCSVCDEVLTAPTVVEALQHDLDEGSVTTPPSCTEAGVLTKSCSRCDYTETEEISNTGHTEVEIPAVDATCTTAGSTAGVKCSVCGEILNAQEEISALGHTAGGAVVENEVAATCADAGSYDSVVYCELCGTEMSRTEVEIPATGEHSYVDGTCEICGTKEVVEWRVKVATFNVSLEAEVIMNYYVVIPDALLADDDAYATMTVNGTPLIEKIPMSEIRTTFNSSNSRCTIGRGVPSLYMTKQVELRIYDGKGNIATLYTSSSEGDYVGRSVQDYIESRLKKNIDDKERNLLVALATYGGNSQIYFREVKNNQQADATPLYAILSSYNLSPLDTSSITGATVNRVVDRGTNESGVGLTAKTFTVALDSAVNMTLKFEIASGYTLSDYTFVLTYPEGEANKTMALAAKMEGNRCVLVVDDIAAARWDYEYKITVTNNKNGETNVIGASVLAFVTSKLNNAKATEQEKNVVRAMYLYNQAAKAHFNVK